MISKDNYFRINILKDNDIFIKDLLNKFQEKFFEIKVCKKSLKFLQNIFNFKTYKFKLLSLEVSKNLYLPILNKKYLSKKAEIKNLNLNNYSLVKKLSNKNDFLFFFNFILSSKNFVIIFRTLKVKPILKVFLKLECIHITNNSNAYSYLLNIIKSHNIFKSIQNIYSKSIINPLADNLEYSPF